MTYPFRHFPPPSQWPATVRATRRRVYDPSPTQLELFEPAPVDFAKLASTPLKTMDVVSFHRSDCPSSPVRLASDQYRCNVCGIVWDVDEQRPTCDDSPYP